MTKAELDNWYLEDAVAATDWMQKRLLRREKEKTLDIRRVTYDEILEKQQESLQRVFIKHPDLNIKERVQSLKAQGKTEAEIQELMKGTIEKLQKMDKIVKSNPEYLSAEDGPERAVEAMEKDTTPAQDSKDKAIDTLTARVEELSAELEAMRNSDEGINSVAPRPRADNAKLSAMESELVDTMKKEGASQERIDSALKKYRSNPKGR
jgi:hypothetical protein